MTTLAPDVLYKGPQTVGQTIPETSSSDAQDPDDSDHDLLLIRAVAELTDDCISSMNDRELVFAIRVARVPFLTAAEQDHLPDRDQDTLKRLTLLARHISQNRLTTK